MKSNTKLLHNIVKKIVELLVLIPLPNIMADNFISKLPEKYQSGYWIVLVNQGKLKMQASLKKLRHQPGEHLDFLNP